MILKVARLLLNSAEIQFPPPPLSVPIRTALRGSGFLRPDVEEVENLEGGFGLVVCPSDLRPDRLETHGAEDPAQHQCGAPGFLAPLRRSWSAKPVRTSVLDRRRASVDARLEACLARLERVLGGDVQAIRITACVAAFEGGALSRVETRDVGRVEAARIGLTSAPDLGLAARACRVDVRALVEAGRQIGLDDRIGALVAPFAAGLRAHRIVAPADGDVVPARFLALRGARLELGAGLRDAFIPRGSISAEGQQTSDAERETECHPEHEHLHGCPRSLAERSAALSPARGRAVKREMHRRAAVHRTFVQAGGSRPRAIAPARPWGPRARHRRTACPKAA